MKKVLFLLFCQITLGSFSTSAQTVESKVVIMQVYYTVFSTFNISIIYGPGKIITSEPPARSTAQAGEALQVAINKLYQEGYGLKSTFSTGTANNATLIFIKEE